jgi:hypothetical protein
MLIVVCTRTFVLAASLLQDAAAAGHQQQLRICLDSAPMPRTCCASCLKL